MLPYRNFVARWTRELLLLLLFYCERVHLGIIFTRFKACGCVLWKADSWNLDEETMRDLVNLYKEESVNWESLFLQKINWVTSKKNA